MKVKSRARVAGIILFTTAILISALILTGYLFSKRMVTEKFSVKSDVNLRVCHLSDLHFPNEGVPVEEISEAIFKEQPNLIVTSGDMLDGNADDNDLKKLSEFYFELRKTAPVYGTIGNHEIGSPLYEKYLSMCRENGIVMLVNETTETEINGVAIQITGLSDGCLLSEKNLPDLSAIKNANTDVSFLLAHRPELFSSYIDGNFSAIFTGHAHGGQGRIFNRGLYAPNQGWFPEYTSGLYEQANSKMFVSRGLGDGKDDFRYFNPYHLVIVEFKSD